ncbi:Fe2+ transport protein FeoA, partial [Dysosmobacter welbionis]
RTDSLVVGPWIILGLHHNLRDSKQSNEGDDQVDTTHEPIASKGKAGGAADIVHADGSHEQADASADQSLENTVV